MSRCLRHQAITWTKVDLSSVRSSDIYLREILLPQPPITKISLNITSNLPNLPELNPTQGKSHLPITYFCHPIIFNRMAFQAEGVTSLPVSSWWLQFKEIFFLW